MDFFLVNQIKLFVVCFTATELIWKVGKKKYNIFFKKLATLEMENIYTINILFLLNSAFCIRLYREFPLGKELVFTNNINIA